MSSKSKSKKQQKQQKQQEQQKQQQPQKQQSFAASAMPVLLVMQQPMGAQQQQQQPIILGQIKQGPQGQFLLAQSAFAPGLGNATCSGQTSYATLAPGQMAFMPMPGATSPRIVYPMTDQAAASKMLATATGASGMPAPPLPGADPPYSQNSSQTEAANAPAEMLRMHRNSSVASPGESRSALLPSAPSQHCELPVDQVNVNSQCNQNLEDLVPASFRGISDAASQDDSPLDDSPLNDLPPALEPSAPPPPDFESDEFPPAYSYQTGAPLPAYVFPMAQGPGSQAPAYPGFLPSVLAPPPGSVLSSLPAPSGPPETPRFVRLCPVTSGYQLIALPAQPTPVTVRPTATPAILVSAQHHQARGTGQTIAPQSASTRPHLLVSGRQVSVPQITARQVQPHASRRSSDPRLPVRSLQRTPAESQEDAIRRVVAGRLQCACRDFGTLHPVCCESEEPATAAKERAEREAGGKGDCAKGDAKEGRAAASVEAEDLLTCERCEETVFVPQRLASFPALPRTVAELRRLFNGQFSSGTSKQPYQMVKVYDIDELSPGCQIAFRRPLGYYHHAIVTDVKAESFDTVEYDLQTSGSGGLVRVLERSREFAKECPHLYRVDYRSLDCFAPETVVTRARRRLNLQGGGSSGGGGGGGGGGYSLISSNCEHLAVWAKTGAWQSFQLRELERRLGAVDLGERGGGRQRIRVLDPEEGARDDAGGDEPVTV